MPCTLHKSRQMNRLSATHCRFMAFLLLFLGWMTISISPASAQSQTPIRILVFGDSLSAAYNLNASQGWVALLEQRLKQSQPTAVVINASVSGETTLGGLARLKGDLVRHKPTHVLLQLGANDGLRGLPLADIRKNLETMLQQIRAAKAAPILIGIQIPPNYGLDYAQEFRDLYPTLAKSQKATLVPFLLAGIAEKRELFLPDGLHPGATAQPMVLDNVWPVLQSSLRSRR
jgi:acyl-CoA thioesterase-1